MLLAYKKESALTTPLVLWEMATVRHWYFLKTDLLLKTTLMPLFRESRRELILLKERI